jgi:hypothetical protein
MIAVLTRRETHTYCHVKTQTQRKASHVEMEAEKGAVLTPRITRSCKRHGRILPQRLQKKPGPADTLILDFWLSKL